MYTAGYYEVASEYLSMQMAEPSDDEHDLAKWLLGMCLFDQKRRKARSLDIGCGAGRMTQAFQDSGWEAVGVDLSLTAIEAGRNRGLDLRIGDLKDKGLGLFDLITGFHFLEHVHSPRRFLLRCAMLLGRRGLLLIEVPNYACKRASKMGKNWPYLYPDSHLYQFTPDTIRRYLHATDFDMIQIYNIHGRGPLENNHRCLADGPSKRMRLKDLLFATRHIFYWSSAGRKIARRLFWHILGYGECIQILARKRS
ncbi:MAG: class I SAM-dependent methyltransferase [Thermodesulfobacteriota bacterium]|jgi:2-polyprenyl-3-methyl-5-hydroxy-6-metoxy-1,4-benzoquinol methylase